MEEKIFATAINKEHEFSDNKYVLGRLSGIKYIVCDGVRKPHVGPMVHENGTPIMFTKCTEDQYAEFARIVENVYPGLCIFRYTYAGPVLYHENGE